MIKPFELFVPYAPSRSATVVAVSSTKYGFIISRVQLLRAKRKLSLPDWALVYLRPNSAVKQLLVVSSNDSCEVITCAS